MNTRINVVGLRYHVPSQQLAAWFGPNREQENPFENKTLYLMRDHRCSVDDYAVLALDTDAVVGYVSRMDAPRCAEALRRSGSLYLSARVVGCDEVRTSLVVELPALPALDEADAAPVDWHYDGAVMRLPRLFAEADCALAMAEELVAKPSESDDARVERVMERFMRTTVDDLSGEAYQRRRLLACQLAASDDARLRCYAPRVFALMDHMGSDEQMERWTQQVLPQVLGGEEARRILARYPDADEGGLLLRMRQMPHELGRDWLSGEHQEFVRRLYYRQIARRQLMHLFTLVAQYEACKGTLPVAGGEVPMEVLTGSIPSLSTPEAHALFERLHEAGMLDSRLQPVGLSGSERGLLVSILSERLSVACPWKDFGSLWHIKPESLRRGYYKSQEQRKSLQFRDRVSAVLSLDGKMAGNA